MSTDELMDISEELGKPMFYNFDPGTAIMIRANEVLIEDEERFVMVANEGTKVSIVPDLLTFRDAPMGKPNMFMTDLRKCLEMQSTVTGKVIGWLCWR